MKILGLVLLMLGLILICWTLYSSYSIFTGRGEAPEIFKAPEAKILAQPEETAEEILKDQLTETFFVDTNILPETANLLVWGFLAFILIFGGGQLAGLGIKMMK